MFREFFEMLFHAGGFRAIVLSVKSLFFRRESQMAQILLVFPKTEMWINKTEKIKERLVYLRYNTPKFWSIHKAIHVQKIIARTDEHQVNIETKVAETNNASLSVF